ncbi:uncharacterized protein LOC129770709 isoform X2 [Toxorhynchites rutilus septentrionalis]|uniref:uncharacterized protein LOC129770709 isoform X2 n=1 Tax=Toxorhynchites rutilus septentrionalis TaxID=329112 RepID=UPI0024797818|nr:uncharacterized protein LOC129770709 isoform X2 [Toxorhynchites rutilus septentrionalis]
MCLRRLCHTGRHLDHTFKSLDVIYKSKKQIMEKEIEKLTHSMEEIALIVKKTDRSMELVKKLREGKPNQIRALAELAIKEFDNQVEGKLHLIQEHKSSLLDIEKTCKQIKNKVTRSTRSQLISEQETILKEIDKIQRNPNIKFKHTQVEFNISTPVLFGVSGVFFIEEVSSFLNTKKTVYSAKITSDNQVWIIYCTNTHVEGYLSLYLKSENGSPYCLQLMHPNAEKNVNTKSKQRFHNNSCWGYNKLILLKTIFDDNYQNDNDSLELLFNIRPSTDENDSS